MRATHVIAVAATALVLAAFIATRVGDDGAPATDHPAPAASSSGTPTPPSPGVEDAAPAPSGEPSPEPARTSRTIRLGGVDLTITAAEVRPGEPRADGTRRITTSGRIAYSTGTPGARVDEHGDDSVTVLLDGTPVAALTAAREPAGTTGTSRAGSALVAGDTALESATWAERDFEGGLSLAVVPAPWIRGGGEATLELLAAQLTAAEPDAGSDTMRDQLTCHHLGAPDKASWNLEPWRPDAGIIGTVAARCNPVD
ncbi:DUF2599 domain-containing protein [Myceligenerans crystallogenes]|uniref:DUF2599 domain-containing protein n=1 Tax=Myceligenerans crystallogenes TaxID=316335 RepID=A0ABN2NF66_9MICO